MINHVRTLLLNQARGAFDGRIPGEEYVPAGFAPKQLPDYLQTIHRIIFGQDADRYMRNFRLRQLLPAIHTTELHDFALKDDPRITYWPYPAGLVFEPYFGPKVTKGNADNLTVIGDFDAKSGRIFFRWKISVDTANSVSIRDLQTLTTTAASFTTTAGRSSDIALPGTGALFNFLGNPGDSWELELLLRPTRNPGQILADLKAGLSAANLLELWDKEKEEPWLTLRNLWQREDYARPMGALLLATAWRTAQL